MKPYVFIKDKEDKIAFTEKELRKLLDEIYDEGVKDGAQKTYVWSPYWSTDKWTITTSGTTPNYTSTSTTDTSTITL